MPSSSTSPAKDVFSVVLPSMGEGIKEATLTKWLKKVGDTVDADEPLVEVSTDKVDTEIQSPTAGTITALLADEGQVVKVNAPIASLARSGVSAAASAGLSGSAAANPASAPAASGAAAAASNGMPASGGGAIRAESTTANVSGASAASGQRLRSSPLVRRIARDIGIDLTRVTGSGLGGRITKRDIEGLGRSSTNAGLIEPGAIPGGQRIDGLARLQTEVRGGGEFLDGVPVRRQKMTQMRRLIAEHMVRSMRTSPHVTTTVEIDMSRIAATRQDSGKAFEQREGFKLTFTHVLIHATVEAIRRHPLVNSSVDGDEILLKDDINVGCAVAIDSGLIVPVVKQAQELNLVEIARRLNDLVTRARTKKLMPQDVQGGTFSITNPGVFGSITSNPIINQPQVAILCLGAVVKRPVVIDDMIGIRPMMYASLTFDHRVVDGEGGAKFLATFKDIVESYGLPTEAAGG